MAGQRRIVQGWFEVWEVEPGVHALREPFQAERVSSYLVLGRDRALLVDTGTGVGDIRAVVEAITPLPVTLLNSHAHWDHVGGNWRFEEIWIHAAEAADLQHPRDNAFLRRQFAPDMVTGPLPTGVTLESLAIPPTTATRLLQGGETIDLGRRQLRVLHAPGHSPGGVVVVDDDNGFVLSTDVVYAGDLYAYTAGSDLTIYHTTLQRLAAISAPLRALYPSHNDSPIAPDIVVRMADGMAQILAGRAPDDAADGRARHAFDGFAVLVPWGGGAG